MKWARKKGGKSVFGWDSVEESQKLASSWSNDISFEFEFKSYNVTKYRNERDRTTELLNILRLHKQMKETKLTCLLRKPFRN